MEEKAAKNAAKDERQAAAAAKKAAKIADYIARCQKRIDSAVSRKNSVALQNVYTSAPYKIKELQGRQSVITLKPLALLDRDHVWKAFGLPTDMEGYRKNYLGAVADTLNHMWAKDITWPESLTK